MRGEGWTLAAGSREGGGGGRERGRGGARGKQEEKASVRTLGHATEFGWLFTPTEARRRSLIDTAWLRDFGRDIEGLQEEIRRQETCVYSEKTSNHENAAGRDGHSEIERRAGCVCREKTSCHKELSHREAKRQAACVYNENTSCCENAAGRDRHSKLERRAVCVYSAKTSCHEEIRHREAKRQVACVSSKEVSYPENAVARNRHSEIERQAASVRRKETSIHEDAALRESHNEIERLQWELRRAFVCRGDARARHNEENILRTECHSAECCCVAMKGSDQGERRSSPDEAQCGERLAVVPAVITSCRELAVSSTPPQTRALDSSEVGVCNGVTAGEESNRRGSDWGPKVKEGSESHYPNVGESSVSEMSCDLDSGLGTFGDDAATCGVVYSRVQHEAKTQMSAGDDSYAGGGSFLLDTGVGTYTSGAAKCDAYSSMHSDVSRDSGIFTADDTGFLSDAPGDLSLLQELGDALSDEDVSLEPCIQYGSLPLEDIEPGTRRYSRDAGYSVWLARFSNSNDSSSRSWGSYEWEVREDAENSGRSYVTGSVSPAVRRRAKCSPEKNDSNAVFSGEETEEQVAKGKPCSACEKTNERVKATQCRECKNLNNESVSVKQCATCQNPNEVDQTRQQRREDDNRNEGRGLHVAKCVTCKKLLQEFPISRQATQELAEVAKLRQSFQGINKRVEDLRAGLDSLVGEVSKSKHEFMSLERRATHLLASTASSRHRLTRVRALQLLEDRLQEEWWAAYDPSSTPFHENYIV